MPPPLPAPYLRVHVKDDDPPYLLVCKQCPAAHGLPSIVSRIARIRFTWNRRHALRWFIIGKPGENAFSEQESIR